MEGVTDLAFRLWVSLLGSPPTHCTPFLRVTQGFPRKRIPITYAPECTILKSLVPYRLICQLMTDRSSDFIPIAEALLETGAEVNLNCGCPSATVVSHGAGAQLLKDPDRFDALCSAITQPLSANRLSIKMRLGYSDPAEFDGLMAVLAQYPFKGVAVHGRTRVQRYEGLALWEPLHRKALESPLPLWGSGDIIDLDSFYSRFEPSLAGVLVGRGVLRHPFIFRELEDHSPYPPSLPLLYQALAIYSVLCHWQRNDPSTLFNLAEEGYFLEKLPYSEEAFQTFYSRLTEATELPQDPLLLPFDRKNAARLKMLWCSISQRLPEQYKSRMILRAKDTASFFSALKFQMTLPSQALSSSAQELNTKKECPPF